MAYLNKVQLIGNLGGDPEFKVSIAGHKMVTFALATTESYTNKNTGERVSTTQWHNIVGWRGLAELIEKFSNIKKGVSLYVEGSIENSSFDDSNGQKRFYSKIQMTEFKVLTPRSDSPTGQDSNSPFHGMDSKQGKSAGSRAK